MLLVNVFTRAGDHCDEMLSLLPSLARSTLTRQVMKCISSARLWRVAVPLGPSTYLSSEVLPAACCCVIPISICKASRASLTVENIFGGKKEINILQLDILIFLFGIWSNFDSKFYLFQ